MPALSVNELLFESLRRIESKLADVDTKQDHHAERLIRVETLLNERTSRYARRQWISGSTVTAGISGIILGAWQLIKARF